MRYGLGNNKHWIKNRDVFPVQSSVLDEEKLFVEVVKDYSIEEVISCRFLSRGDADIYRVKTATRNFYLKVYRPPKSLEDTEAEAILVWALSEAEFPVVNPVHRTDGQFATQVLAPEGMRPMLLYDEAPPPIPGELDERILSRIGAMVALFHNTADRLDTHIDIPEIDVDKALQENVIYTSQFLSAQDSAYLRNVAARLGGFLRNQPRKTIDFGICHADLVMSNVRMTKEGEITLFDFGNAMKTWREFELAVIYSSLGHRYENDRENLWRGFLRGYESNRPLPGGLPENLNAMLVFRQIGFLGGNCASLPLRLGTEPFESGFIENEIKRLKQFADQSGIIS